jgi:hypothetical protein
VEFVDSCIGADHGEAALTGSFEYWEGECRDAETGGRPVYYNSVTAHFLFWHISESNWFVDGVCGRIDNVAAYGGAGLYPFEDTATTWYCASSNAGISKSVSIECSFFDGQPSPCSPGKYEPAGEAPGGDCASSCPHHLPTSPPAPPPCPPA